METAIVAAFAFWGYQSGDTMIMKILFAIGAPLIGFGFWGVVDFHQVGRAAEPLRLIEELLISGLAAVALFTVGQQALGWALGVLSLVYHALVYLAGDRLLKSQS